MKKEERKFNNNRSNLFNLIKNYSYSIQYLSFITGIIMSAAGLLIVLFLRDIQFTGIILIVLGLLSIAISAIFNISKIKIFLFSSKGLYSANTFFILIGTLIISILINSVIYVSNKNGVAPSWFRSDLTASKEYDLSSQALNAIENLNENKPSVILIAGVHDVDRCADFCNQGQQQCLNLECYFSLNT